MLSAAVNSSRDPEYVQGFTILFAKIKNLKEAFKMEKVETEVERNLEL